MDKKAEMALTHMRKTVQKLGGSTETYGDPTLLRFLNSRSMDAEKAAKMFVQWQTWRANFVPNGFIPDSQIPDKLAERKAYLQGLSKDGYPVLIFKGCNHFPGKDPLQGKRFVVYMMDKAIASGIKEREIGNEKIIVLIDLRQLTHKNFDPRGLVNAVQIMQAYYPQRMAKLYVFYMPRFIESVQKMVCRYLNMEIRTKVEIARNEADRKRFIAEIGEDVLPNEFGGRAKLVALQDVTVPPLNG